MGKETVGFYVLGVDPHSVIIKNSLAFEDQKGNRIDPQVIRNHKLGRSGKRHKAVIPSWQFGDAGKISVKMDKNPQVENYGLVVEQAFETENFPLGLIHLKKEKATFEDSTGLYQKDRTPLLPCRPGFADRLFLLNQFKK